MRRDPCCEWIACTLALAVRRRARERGMEAFYRDQSRPCQEAEAEGWDAAQGWVVRARRLPRALLGPRSRAWLARREEPAVSSGA
jgi:hypothetical protein